MTYPFTFFVSTLFAYLIGSMPFGYWFMRLTRGSDIRTMGSGNIGATNVQRSAGAKAGVTVLLLDILKGLLAVSVALLWSNHDVTASALAACAVMVGHCYPVFLGFKGGKAVAAFVGAFAVIAPLPLLAVVPVFFLTVFLTRYVSLASLVGAACFPVLVMLIQHPPAPILYASLFAGVLIFYRHHANIRRLLAGNENAFSLKGRKA